MKKYIALLLTIGMPLFLLSKADSGKREDVQAIVQVSQDAGGKQKQSSESTDDSTQKDASQQQLADNNLPVPQKNPVQVTQPDDNLVELDAIYAIVFTEHGKEVITQSDVLRSGLTGQQRPLDEIIFERLVYLDAKKHKIDIDDAAVERYLARVISENNLRPEDLKSIFANEGFTLEEGKQHLQKMQTVSTMIDFKIRSNLVIPKKEITKYYEENPEVDPAEYYIEIASVVFDPGTKREVQKKNLYNRAVGLGQGPALEWMEPFWIKAADLAQDKQFIATMNVGDIEIVKSDAAFVIYRMKEVKFERVKTLDERYHEITDVLRMPKYETLVMEYRDSLFNSASIVKMA